MTLQGLHLILERSYIMPKALHYRVQVRNLPIKKANIRLEFYDRVVPAVEVLVQVSDNLATLGQ
jgi:hypothetical protein